MAGKKKIVKKKKLVKRKVVKKSTEQISESYLKRRKGTDTVELVMRQTLFNGFKRGAAKVVSAHPNMVQARGHLVWIKRKPKEFKP